MDYKKILAVTTITSAAIIIPVVAQAEGTTPEAIDQDTTLIPDDSNYTYGNTIKAGTEISYEAENAEGIKETVTAPVKTYEWYIGDTKVSSTTSNFIVPIDAIDKKVKVVVTTDKGIKRYDEVTINALDTASIKFKDDNDVINEAVINSTITASGFKIPNSLGENDIGEVITGYQWYIFDETNKKYELLSGETDVELDVPFKAQGKELLFVISTNKGNYYGETIKVDKFKLNKNDVGVTYLFNGKNYSDLSDMEFVAGDTISIKNISIVGGFDGGNDVILDSSQYNVKYQWYAVDTPKVNPENKEVTVYLLNNANNASFTVPADSENKNYQRFRVEITISVPQLSDSFIKLVEVGKGLKNTESLEQYIAKLIDSSKYNTDFVDSDFNEGDFGSSDVDVDEIEILTYERFKSYVNFLNEEYGNLSTNRKQLIKNYSILQEATKDVQVLDKFNEELVKFYKEKLNYDSENSEVKHADLTKKFTALKKSYDKLTARQLSLLDFIEIEKINAVEYIRSMQEWLTKIDPSFKNDSDYITFSKIDEINQNILELFIIDNTIEANNYLIAQEYNYVTLKEFEDEIKKLTVEAGKIDKKYQPLIYTSALKTAQSNLKKAQAVIEKINKIETTTDTKKKTSAYLAAQKAFDNLTSLQQSLVTNVEALKDNGEDNISNQIKKDIKAADKVVKAFNDAEKLEDVANSIDSENIKGIISKLKSAKSKYQSAYKAYIKLTPKVRLLVDSSLNKSNMIASFDTVIKKIDDEIDSLSEKESMSQDAANLIEKITLLEQDVTNGNTDAAKAKTTLDELKDIYKNLASANDKKKVYNYSILSTINSHISKAKSVETKLINALKENTVSKLQSAQTAYNKLLEPQQKLVDKELIEDLEDALEELQGEKASVSEIEDLFAKLNKAAETDYTIENVKLAEQYASNLTSKELKAISNYKAYQDALKDLKAVETFIAKIEKIKKSPTYSNIQTIIAGYNKLTKKQALLFVSVEEPENYYELLETWTEELNNKAEKLNTLIGSVLISGVYQLDNIDDIVGNDLDYINSFNTFLNNIDAEYKKLNSKEKKLVPHYSIVTQAKKDAKAVKTVVELAVQFNKAKDNNQDTNAIYQKWQLAYNKLTSQQQSLFKLAMPDFE